MGADTKIEWARHTFNAWKGCTKVSPACDFCYAWRWAKRIGRPELWEGERELTTDAYWHQPFKWDCAAKAAGERHRVFCNSLADVFDNQVPEAWRDDLFCLIKSTPNLDWLLLTKRPQNIADMLPGDWGEGYPNVWLGTTAENQEEWDRRLEHLAAVRALVHFVSVEPLLGPIDCGNAFDLPPDEPPAYSPIDWVICGGESGPGARPMHPDWARALRDQCAAAGVPFFFKQFGEWAPSSSLPIDERLSREEATVLPDGRVREWEADYPGARLTAPDMASMRRVGKKCAGRLLDGREHNEFPEIRR
jgi:protein gp37